MATRDTSINDLCFIQQLMPDRQDDTTLHILLWYCTVSHHVLVLPTSAKHWSANTGFHALQQGPFHTDVNYSCELFARVIRTNSSRECTFTLTLTYNANIIARESALRNFDVTRVAYWRSLTLVFVSINCKYYDISSTESHSVIFTAGEVLEHASATKLSAGNDASVPYLFQELRRDQSRFIRVCNR